MSKLFDGDDSDSDVNIKTDNQYAKNYDIWRQKEELNKLKTVYGEEALNDYDDSSSSSSEDEDAKELTEEVEKDFFRTLACLKNKDPKIYDKDVNFFSENKEQNTKKKKTKPEKPITLRDHERKLLLEGDIEDLDASERPQSPTFVEEQKQIRDSLLKIVHDDESENEKDSEDFGGIFHKREKTKEDKEKEEEEYRQWLAGKKKELENKNEESELKPLKDYWNNPTLDENESFLRDYLLNKRFLDDEDDSYIPSYEEIVHDSDENLSEDEKNIEAQEEFEHKYNFRFEEPDQEFLKRYPRTMEHSVRRKDDKRKKKRAELKERKAQEKARKCEELKQLKSLKRKEIEEKIQQLREITGNEQICFQDEDIEGDFDPEAHDARMQEIFNNDFYAVEESDQKPVFPEDDDFMEDDWDNWKGEQDDYDNAPHCEDDDFNMDCDYDPTTKTTKNNDTQNMLIENSCSKRNRRRKSKFAEVLAQKKPVFDPNDKTYEEYLDEYYKLDYEDMIGDLPCRFKYKKVMPNSFGLTIDEILAAKDKELNSWCSLKKAVQIRPDHVEKYDQIAYERKSRNLALKKKALKSLYQEPEEEDPEIKWLTVDISENNKRKTEEGEEMENDSNMNKRKKKVSNELDVNQENDLDTKQENVTDDGNQDSLSKAKAKKRKNKNKVVKNESIANDNQNTRKESNDLDVKQKNVTDGNKNSLSVETKRKNKDKIVKNESAQNENQNKKKDKFVEHIASFDKNKDCSSNVKSDVNAPISLSRRAKKNRKRKQKILANGNVIVKKSNKVKKNKEEINLSESRLRAYGINPKKFKNKQKFKNKIVKTNT